MGIFDSIIGNLGLTRNGPYKKYHKNGNLIESGTWKNAKQVGLWKLFYDEVQILLEQPHNDNGVIHGLSKFYNKNGQLIREEYYDNGEFESQKCWDKNGNEVECKNSP